MKYLTLLICCLALIACEEEPIEPALSSDIIGTWSVTNWGQYASANCTGEIDYTGWGVVVAFGVSMEFTFLENGTGELSSTIFGMTESESFTWDVDGEQLCLDGECATPILTDDTFTIIESTDAYCEDDMGEEVDGVTMTACEAAGNDWYDAACYEWTATRQ